MQSQVADGGRWIVGMRARGGSFQGFSTRLEDVATGSPGLQSGDADCELLALLGVGQPAGLAAAVRAPQRRDRSAKRNCGQGQDRGDAIHGRGSRR